MSPQVIRLLVIGAFAMHGIGMLGGAMYLPFDKDGGFIGASWLLGRGPLAIAVGVVVWTVAGIGYIGAAIGFWQGAAGWGLWAWPGAMATLVAVALWAGAVKPGVYVGGLLAVGTIVYLVL